MQANVLGSPNWHQAMNGLEAEGCRDEMDMRIKTLIGMDSWLRTNDMNIIKSTWSFKCKCFPDGRIKKLKSRFCIR
eukprot:5710522-Ditylum_brightwellii.AAC.1